jgi:hypothetical protein
LVFVNFNISKGIRLARSHFHNQLWLRKKHNTSVAYSIKVKIGEE